MRVSSYSKVGAKEQRYMVNSGVRGTKEENLRSRCIGKTTLIRVEYLFIYPITRKYRVPVIYTTGTPGDFVVASGSLLVLPLAAADTRWQYSTLHYTGGSTVRYAMQGQQRGAQERRREGGTRERGTGRRKSLELLVVRQQELG